MCTNGAHLDHLRDPTSVRLRPATILLEPDRIWVVAGCPIARPRMPVQVLIFSAVPFEGNCDSGLDALVIRVRGLSK